MIIKINILLDDNMMLYAVAMDGEVVSWHPYSEMPSELLRGLCDIREGRVPFNLDAEYWDRFGV